jgi:rare lipoprotein A (peptidoglycan hydrolase)
MYLLRHFCTAAKPGKAHIPGSIANMMRQESAKLMSSSKYKCPLNVFIGILAVIFILMDWGSCANERMSVMYPSSDRDGLTEVSANLGERKLAHVSWYGEVFHGRPTASGESFDMYALTCAHRDYPFGTLLRVRNPRTGSECKCTVNDRGPFIAGRDLDLSYAVAMCVDLVDLGIAQLYIEPVGRDPRYI